MSSRLSSAPTALNYMVHDLVDPANASLHMAVPSETIILEHGFKAVDVQLLEKRDRANSIIKTDSADPTDHSSSFLWILKKTCLWDLLEGAQHLLA